MAVRKTSAGIAIRAASFAWAAFGLLPCAVAQPAPLPEPSFGDAWTYRTTDLFTGLETGRFSLKFLRKDARDLKFTSIDLKSGHVGIANRTLDLGYCLTSRDIKTESCGGPYSFPLEVGKRHSYEHRPNAGSYGFSGEECKVEAMEKVTVPAGTFDAFRVECFGRWTSGGGQLDYIYTGQLHDTHWYASAINGEVKYVFRSFGQKGGMVNQSQTELVSFTRAGAGDVADADTSPTSGTAEASTTTTAGAFGSAMPMEFVNGTTRFAGQFVAEPGNAGYSGTGRVEWANGDVYEGPLVKGSRQGRGKFVWANGQQFEGDWRRDRPDGRGRLKLVNGDIYDGEIAAGVPKGSGLLTYASGDRYIGQVADGMPDGRGHYLWANGQSLEGEWNQGHAEGNGDLHFANGDRYEGELALGVPNGAGRISYASGDSYVGHFKAGAADSDGTYTWKEGGSYVGQWKAGLKEGRGTITWANGDRWEGLFVNDQRTEGAMVRKPD